MGNYISCTFVFVPIFITKNNHQKAARVIFPTGEVKLYREPVSVAELMLECPNHFIANSHSLCIGQRFSRLNADENLEDGHVYVFFHMRRTNTLVTPSDMAMFLVAEGLAVKRLTGGGSHATRARVMQNCGSGGGVHHQSKQDQVVVVVKEGNIPRLSLEGVDLGFMHRVTGCKSRKPTLETIKE